VSGHGLRKLKGAVARGKDFFAKLWVVYQAGGGVDIERGGGSNMYEVRIEVGPSGKRAGLLVGDKEER
jgi:hypothetical protein